MTRKTMTLREARVAAGMTINELSVASGVHYSTILAIEHNRTPGNIRDRHRLSDALGRPFQEIWPDTVAELAELMNLIKSGRRTKVKP